MPHFDSFLFKSLLAFITGQCLAQYYPHIAFSSLFVFLGLCFVIADGSNGSWNLDRWRKSCDRNGIAFKATRDGAVSISL